MATWEIEHTCTWLAWETSNSQIPKNYCPYWSNTEGKTSMSNYTGGIEISSFKTLAGNFLWNNSTESAGSGSQLFNATSYPKPSLEGFNVSINVSIITVLPQEENLTITHFQSRKSPCDTYAVKVTEFFALSNSVTHSLPRSTMRSLGWKLRHPDSTIGGWCHSCHCVGWVQKVAGSGPTMAE